MSDQLQTLYTIIETLPQGLKDHLYRTQQVGSALSLRFGVDPYKVMLGTLGHDIYRAVSEQQLLEAATLSGIAVEPIEIRIPILLHGPLAAFRLQRDCGIDDKEILEAVRWHSTGWGNIDKVGLVVFLADKLDPVKVEKAAKLKVVERLAEGSLEGAALQYLTDEINWLLGTGDLLHPASIECRNFLLSQAESNSS